MNTKTQDSGPTIDGDPLADRDFSSLQELLPPTGNGNVPAVHQTVIMAQSREITARKVAVARSLPMVMQKIKAMCAAFGDSYVYSWEVKDRTNGRKQTIEGPTIKLANDILMLYGNCSVDVDIQDTPTHWIFKAWFMDYESGVSMSRMFQQRKQGTGMKDVDRQADIVFQIGQSKAERNVIVNALSSLTNYAIDEAKKNMVEKFNDPANKEKALNFIYRTAEKFGITVDRVEATIGRVIGEWTVRDIAKVYMEMRGIADGMTSADEIYPSSDDAREVMTTKQRKDAEDKMKPKADDKKVETKAETKTGDVDLTPPASMDRRGPDAKNAAEGKPKPETQTQTKDAPAEHVDSDGVVHDGQADTGSADQAQKTETAGKKKRPFGQ